MNYRTIVPAGYQLATLELTGTSPLLMHSAKFDHFSDEYQSFALLSRKSKKTLDDELRLSEMEWALGLYMDDELGPFIPSENVHELLQRSATKWKMGTTILTELVVMQTRIPLQYDGPRDQAGLWEEKFIYSAMAKNSGFNAGRVWRTRPCFQEWTLTVPLGWNPEEIDVDLMERVIERAQKLGIGDYRPVFGRFQATLALGELNKTGARVSATKKRDPHTEHAQRAFREAIVPNGSNGSKRNSKKPMEVR